MKMQSRKQDCPIQITWRSKQNFILRPNRTDNVRTCIITTRLAYLLEQACQQASCKVTNQIESVSKTSLVHVPSRPRQSAWLHPYQADWEGQQTFTHTKQTTQQKAYPSNHSDVPEIIPETLSTILLIDSWAFSLNLRTVSAILPGRSPDSAMPNTAPWATFRQNFLM